MMTRKHLLFYIFLVFSLSISGQVKKSLFKNYSVQNGLNDEKIHTIHQDQNGFIWLGTDYGVVNFDAYSFKRLDLYDSISYTLNKSLIRTIKEDNDGNIWIGSELNGLFIYNKKKNSIKNIRFGNDKANSVWSIFHCDESTVILGTEDGVIIYDILNKRIKTQLNTSTSEWETGDIVRSIFMADNGKFWIGTDHGITILNNNYSIDQHLLLKKNKSNRNNEVWSIFQDSEKQIWIGTYLDGLLRYNAERNNFTVFQLDPENVRAVTVRAITQDKKGDLWFGTRGGLYSYDYASQKTMKYTNSINDQQSLVHNSVLDLLVDKKGDLWIGTRNGASFLNFAKEAFGHISANKAYKNELNNGEIYSIWEDRDQNLWIGTESGGVNIINESTGTIDYITTDNGLSSNCIKDVEPLDKENVMIATYLGGLNILNTKTNTIKVLKHDPNDSTSIADNSVWKIYTDSKNRIWVGTSDGLDLFDPSTNTFKHFKDKYNVGLVDMIYEDNANNIWVYSTNTDKLTRISPSGSYKEFNIKTRAMVSDKEGNIWIASLGEGLLFMKKGSDEIIKYTEKDGLCSNVLFGIINIDGNHLWLSSNKELSRFDIKEKTFKNFNTENGLLNTKFNYGAYFVRQNGDLVFGGKKGIDFVYTHKLKENRYLPPVIFTELRIFNEVITPGKEEDALLKQPLSETESIVLKHNQNMISFEFAALNYANSGKNSYEYILEGFDKNWNKIGSSRKATYTNLDHGEYTLKVKGSNNDLLSAPTPTELKITITPPFWKTWWFSSILLIVILLILYTLYNLILNREKLRHQLTYERRTSIKMQEIERSKHQFFMNISHELRTPLSLILGPLKKLDSDQSITGSVKDYISLMKKNAETLYQLVNQLLDYRKLETGNVLLNPKTGNISQFTKDIVSSFTSAANDKDITLEFKSNLDNSYADYDSNLLSKILNNLISNSIKYSLKNKRISITVSLSDNSFIDDTNTYTPSDISDSKIEEQYIQIKVKDQGIGMQEEDIPKIFTRFKRLDTSNEVQAEGTGIGLSLTKDLVKIHKGFLYVESTLGEGSTFSIYLPFNISQIEEKEEETTDSEIVNVNEEAFDKDENNNDNKPVVLIVDDNNDLRKFMHNHFEPEYHVLDAEDGKKAWDIAIETVPDIIIADVMMPIMNGKELCKKLKKDERTSHIPVIILSALSSNENQLEGIDSGADDYLTKPFDADLLKAKADNLLLIRKKLRERYSGKMSLKPSEVVLASPDEKFIKKFTAFVEKNIADASLDVEVIASNIGVSRTQLYRKIKALTGSSPKEIVRDFRLVRSSQLLVQNKINITEVSMEVGFSDVAYFRKCFKAKFGMSPTEYVKKNVKE